MGKPKLLKTDITIIGAGAVGLVAALILVQRGFSIVLIEKGNPSDVMPKALKDSHTTALMNKSLSVIKRTGIWDRVEAFTQDMDILRIYDPSAAEAKIVDFTADEVGKKTFGKNVPQTPLRAALLKQVKSNKFITYMPETDIEAIESDAFKGVIKTGSTTIETQLIIGCDGKHSITRQAMDVEAVKRDYAQMALTFLVKHSLPHKNTSTEIHKEGGPLTFVPLPDQASSVVWVERKDEAERLLSLKKQELLQILQDKSEGILGQLEIVTNVMSWPLSSHKAKSLTAPRTIFIGEAAHSFSPVGAQGLNLSLRDIETLDEILKEALFLGQDIGSEILLKRYEKHRKLDTEKRFYGTDILNYFIASEKGFEKKLRRIGLGLVERIKPLKHFLMREGMSPKSKA